MPNEGGLQLLPETRKKIEIIIPGENRLLVIGAVVLAISAALAGSLYFYNNYLEDKLVSLDGKLAALEQNRNRQSEQNILQSNGRKLHHHRQTNSRVPIG